MANSFIQVPPDGSGKKVYTKDHIVDASTVQVQAVHLSDPVNPAQFLAVDSRGSAAVRFAEGQPVMSGFGSLKTSNQRALGVYESSMDTYDDLFTVRTVNGGVNTYDGVAASHVLSVTGDIGSKVSRTTNRYHYYLPGTSNTINMTVSCGDTGKIGNTRRWGAFDDKDGIFFELKDNVVCVVLRSSTTGNVVETKVTQANWNSDPIDGTGISDHILDITKVNVWWMDYQWLGAGRVRFGIFEPSGARLVCHEFKNAGGFALPYMRTGTLPLRTENENTGTTGAGSELREVCMAIYAEGTYEDYTFWRNADMFCPMTLVNVADKHLLSVKSKTTISGHHNSIQTYPEVLSVYTDLPVSIMFYQDTTVTGSSWEMESDSAIDGTTMGTLDLSGATRKFATLFFGPGAHNYNMTHLFEVNDEGIMCKASGETSIWSITATTLGPGAANVLVSLQYRELW